MDKEIKLLRSLGFDLAFGMITPPPTFVYGTIATKVASDAIDELCEEWDFYYNSEPCDCIDPT